MGTVHQLSAVRSENANQRVAPRRRVLMRGNLRVRGNPASYPATIRDISSTGLKLCATVNVFAGTQVEIELPNIGWVPGEIVRMEQERVLGIRFAAVIDPESTQTKVSGSYGAPPPALSPTLRRV